MASMSSDQPTTLTTQKQIPPVPPAPPPGWITRFSTTNPDLIFYFNLDTGESTWERPTDDDLHVVPLEEATDGATATATSDEQAQQQAVVDDTAALVQGVMRQVAEKKDSANPRQSKDRKRSREHGSDNHHSRKSSSRSTAGGSHTEKVRVLHILKKHAGVRRPSSHRNANITDTKEKAISDLETLIEMLKEAEEGDELRATFEELAKAESDCSSFKRGGDLGYFGRRKMQPAFEKASFALKVGELSGIVETSSGVHVILRLG